MMNTVFLEETKSIMSSYVQSDLKLPALVAVIEKT
jgi:hypothetical protein